MEGIRYSIKDLENFTQIKAHTIRIWEQRYKLLAPKRTETNIRYYNEDDLKKLLNINLLYSHGFKISKIGKFTDEELIENAKALVLNERQKDGDIRELTLSLIEYKGEEMINLLRDRLDKFGVEATYSEIIFPFLNKLGELWQVNTIEVAHEHYFSNIFKALIHARIENLPAPQEKGKKVVLFLPDHEEHEFSLLLNYYILKKAGLNCFYFGRNTPLVSASEAIDFIKPDIVVTSLIAQISEKSFFKIIEVLRGYTKASKVLLSGAQVKIYSKFVHPDIITLSSLDEMSAFVKKLDLK